MGHMEGAMHRNRNTKEGRGGLLAGEADWLCAGKCCNLSAGKSPRAIIQKRGSKTG